MKFLHEESKTSFEVTDKPTVLEQLTFSGEVLQNAGQPVFVRNFLAGRPLIKNWKSPTLKDPSKLFVGREPDVKYPRDAVFLSESTDTELANILIFVGNSVVIHMMNLDEVPKN